MLTEILGLFIYAICLIALVLLPILIRPVLDAIQYLLGRACWELEHKLLKPVIRRIKRRF